MAVARKPLPPDLPKSTVLRPEEVNRLPPVMTPDEVADVLRMQVETLRFWRTVRKGPRYWKSGLYVRYAREDVLKWLDDARANGTITYR